MTMTGQGAIAVHGAAGQRLLEQLAAVLDPIAERYAGAAEQTVRPVLRAAWRESFRTELREPALSRRVAAVASGRPWTLALWSNDWP